MPTLFQNTIQDHEYAYRFVDVPSEGVVASVVIALGLTASFLFLAYALSVVVRIVWSFVWERRRRRRGKVGRYS